MQFCYKLLVFLKHFIIDNFTMPVLYMQCGPKCRSKKHAYEIIAAISKGNLQEVQSFSRLCYNGTQLWDQYGRSALHMAASCGKVDIVLWLLEEKNGDVTQKDLESGWTALHRAIFYGQINIARMLIQYKSDLYTRDHEGLGPLDVAMKDRELVQGVPPSVFKITDRHEVFTWGDNSNFTLGHSTEQLRHIPEVVDVFRKQDKRIKQIAMCKYHTVFLTTDGQVYTCGHGHGGRLGHPSEETCLVPKLIESLKMEECVDIASARDHTLILTKSALVYSCGMNNYHQLGQFPVLEKCLVPKPIKTVKGRAVLGICAGRFHTVVYTSQAVFTCGLNAGQMGHPKPKGDPHVTQLRQVSAVNVKKMTIVSVQCSDAATVILTQVGELYVLHEYQCRKMASNRLDIQRLCVVGGNLDHLDSEILRENGGRQLIISYLNQSGKVFIWHEKSPSLKRAHWLIRRQLYIKDFIHTESGLVILTDHGEVFLCTISSKPAPLRESMHINKESTEGEFGRMSLMELLMQEETEEVQVRRVPNVHRASYITADRKGQNYATLQSLPNSCLTDVPSVRASEIKDSFDKLLAEVDEYDLIHDLILQIRNQQWPVHKYILVNRCANFPSILVNSTCTNNEMDVPVIDLPDLHPQILEQLLLYIYTDNCDLLTIGANFVLHAEEKDEDIFHMEFDDVHFEGISSNNKKVSAYQIIQNSNGNVKNKNGNVENRDKRSGSHSTVDRNPVKMLLDVAKTWGVKGLAKRLTCVNYHKGKIMSNGKTMPISSLKFDRNKLNDTKWEMFDVCIQCDDGVIFQCHKCVLVARLEYFHSMLASGWIETSSSKALSLPIPGDILEILLDYLYTDESMIVSSTSNVELLCNILVVADQMLVTRLKEMCETAIATQITLKNVGELLEFATMYNANQLERTCQQFIVLNLPSLLEGRCLDMLGENVVANLTRYYRDSIPNMSRRFITPYDDGPAKALLESLAMELGEVNEAAPVIAIGDQKKSKFKRKSNRTKSFTDENEKGLEKELGNKRGPRSSERHLSVSSDISLKSDMDSYLDNEPSLDTSGKTGIDSSTLPPTSRSPSISWCKFDVAVSPSQSARTGQLVDVQSSSLNVNNSSAVSSPSLRDIMQEEQTKTKIDNQSPAKPGKFSWKNVKKQQQLEKSKSQQLGQPVPAPSVVALEKPTASCPWASLNKVVSSFRVLMVEDQKSIADKKPPVPVDWKPNANKSSNPPSQYIAKGSVSWRIRSNSQRTPKMSIQPEIKPLISTGSASSKSPDNPWIGAKAQSPPDSVCSFTDILKAEQRKTDVLIQRRKKPLSLIQIEEQAILDLLVHYKAAEILDERITVERVVQEAATPLWKCDKLKSF